MIGKSIETRPSVCNDNGASKIVLEDPSKDIANLYEVIDNRAKKVIHSIPRKERPGYTEDEVNLTR